jgi:ABC-type glutathione transport system ATPase component
MIELESVTKKYTLGQQEILAVNEVFLRIQPGDFVAIMGKSGCGKTTLLSLIGGLDRPDSGRINVNGQEITQLADAELTRYRRESLQLPKTSLSPIASKVDQTRRSRLECKTCSAMWTFWSAKITILTRSQAAKCKGWP